MTPSLPRRFRAAFSIVAPVRRRASRRWAGGTTAIGLIGRAARPGR